MVFRAARVCCLLVLVSCSSKARDCDVAFGTLQREGGLDWYKIPKNSTERDGIKGKLEARAAEWDGAKARIKSEEVLVKGEAVADAQRSHARLLAGIDFATLKKPSASPAPTPVKTDAGGGSEREQALREAVASGVSSLLGPQLPAETQKQLDASAKELEQRRLALVDLCTPK